MRQGILYVVSAPSGTGKSSLIHALLDNNTLIHDIKVSISYTTRSIRSGEINGKHYHFITKSKFKTMIKTNMFLEYTKTFDHYYGTNRAAVECMLNSGTSLILNIDWKGANQIRRRSIKMCSIFILPPSITELKNRLYARNQDNEQIISDRMKRIIDEIYHLYEYDYLIINDLFDIALNKLQAIILSEQLRLNYQKYFNNKLIKNLLLTRL